MSALAPVEAVALAVRLLQAEGFVVTARNDRGDSVYLAWPGRAPALRVSNHARTPKQRRKHPEVVTSLVFREPKARKQVSVMVEMARRQWRAAVSGGVPEAEAPVSVLVK